MKLIIERIIFGILAIATCVTIFMFSNENGEKSSNTSGRIVSMIIENLPMTKNLDEKQKAEAKEKLEVVVRKTAHFTIYLILGLNIAGFVSTFDKLTRKNMFIICIAICVLYAISDEIHQMFSEGRTAKIMDIFIDSCGSLCGIYFLLKIKEKIEKRKNKVKV